MWCSEMAQNPDAVRYVIDNMREWDRREIFATRYNNSLPELHESVMTLGPTAWVSGLERPIAAFGGQPMWDGVWSMWLFATDEFNKIGIPMTRLVIRYILPMIREAGAHRMECRSMGEHHEAHRWLEVIGAKREGELKAFGRKGEDFHVYTWDCG